MQAFGRFVRILLEASQRELLDGSAGTEQRRNNFGLFYALGLVRIVRIRRVNAFLDHRLKLSKN